MAFFLRHLTDPTSIAQEPSLSKVVQHVRETAVCLAVLGQADHGTGLLTILHAHGIPPFDLREFGPEVFSEDFARCRSLGKGCDDNGDGSGAYEVPVNPPRADPFTRIVFAFAWEQVGRWPRWATPVPKPFFSSSSGDGRLSHTSSDDGCDVALDALERYARTLVCNRFAPPWREDEETYELARELALGQDNRANPHGPIPMRLAGFWGLWERMLAPWQMNQVVKATGRVLALDLSVRLFRDAVDDGEASGDGSSNTSLDQDRSEEEVIVDEFLPEEDEEGVNDSSGSSTHASEEEESTIELWGRTIATLHTAQDQMPMLGSMRELWRYGWFTEPSKNALVKHLEIDLTHVRGVADAGCEMLRQRLECGPVRPYEGFTIAELARAIDENTRSCAPYAPDELREREDMLVERTVFGPRELDKDKIFRPETLVRHPVPSHKEIEDLERRLELSAPLPDQYKAFFRVTDGMGPVWWNTSQHLRILAPLSKVTVQDDELPASMQLELLPSRGLADGSYIAWPLLRRVICISESGHEGDLWLVEPKYVSEAKDAFFEVYDHASAQDRRLLRREVEEVYGSIDGFRTLEWGLLMWTSWFTEMVPYKDLSAFMDELARGSRRKAEEWTLQFDPSTRKLDARLYKTASALDPDKEVENVEDGKGNLVLSSPGTMAMGPLVYPENAMTTPMVDR
ncbi:hypothetical protein HER10_EVM0008817 [Colletotrichum scovillei]|uniref:Knr4/Smi1-like domain-containing protein n=1 Tax=Colletotrichum scovillei TaxID=1209932 RepID=A0A9P7R0E8_9PEZI|nr:uncharacterized protein HER10_EVM0008817 [Colletotrichum scovillei]KAF4781217.1 hypothetical protein HER10_EVM0008817 [Colletotrichum scovillei]KAG7045622.1 hypothetical protein JMJ77_0009700 [Colletotrichum scovillei]KAG7052784.1 hypothetical protein JMJ78_0005795 [Colletotrichum scovillei]KAG7065075.1 hypothetical protein JMJ76_0012827 [Colletotrichum scovillei]